MVPKRLNFLAIGQCEKIHLKWTRDATNDTGCVILNLRNTFMIIFLTVCRPSLPTFFKYTIPRHQRHTSWKRDLDQALFVRSVCIACRSFISLLDRIGMCLSPQIPAIKSAWCVIISSQRILIPTSNKV